MEIRCEREASCGAGQAYFWNQYPDACVTCRTIQITVRKVMGQ